MESFRVATLNIWNRFGPWEERLAAIRAGFASVAPDILGMQEVLRLAPGEGDGLDQGLAVAPDGWHVAYARATGERWYGNAALSRWPIVRAESFDLPRCGTDEKRSLLFAEIDAPFARVPLFVTHLNWKLDDGHVRAAQLREVVARIESIAGDVEGRRGFPAVLVGDLNAEPEADEIRYLRGLTSLDGERRVYFQDAFGLAGDGSPGFTFARKNPFAAPLREPDRRIDYILVRGRHERFAGEPIDARVCFDEPVDGTYASDHFGVVATLRVS
jgi:endonuclease/exonuclease/phosphatase family metal-dependent hydrolase